MLIDLGKPDDERLRRVIDKYTPWVADAIGRGVFNSWLVCSPDNTPVACAALLLIEWPPNSRDPNPTRGYIMNVWTHPDHRRKGIARHLMDVIIKEANRREIRVLALHASDDGKQLYEQLGFRPSREMIFVDEQ